jgi:putative ABC transport system ATP-binding protein
MLRNKIVLETKKLTKIYRKGKQNEVKALDRVNFKLEKGEFVALVGPSGSGKSTFMHLVGLLQRPTSGKILIGGKDVTAISKKFYPKIRARKIGFVFQGFNLIATLSALENVMLAGQYAGLPSKEARSRARKILTDLGLEGRMGHRPNELSGGQEQRVAIARALINNPEIILADEPTGELDSKNSNEIVKLLKGLSQKGQTILIVTHNLEVARKADKIIKMQDGKMI